MELPNTIYLKRDTYSINDFSDLFDVLHETNTSHQIKEFADLIDENIIFPIDFENKKFKVNYFYFNLLSCIVKQLNLGNGYYSAFYVAKDIIKERCFMIFNSNKYYLFYENKLILKFQTNEKLHDFDYLIEIIN